MPVQQIPIQYRQSKFLFLRHACSYGNIRVRQEGPDAYWDTSLIDTELHPEGVQ